MDVPEIKKSFRELPLEERLRLLYELWDELSPNAASFDLTADEQAELEHRYEEHVRNPGSSISWEQVRNGLRSGD